MTPEGKPEEDAGKESISSEKKKKKAAYGLVLGNGWKAVPAIW